MYKLHFLILTAFDLLSIRGILQANTALLTAKMHGYEGTDVYEVIQNVGALYSIF